MRFESIKDAFDLMMRINEGRPEQQARAQKAWTVMVPTVLGGVVFALLFRNPRAALLGMGLGAAVGAWIEDGIRVEKPLIGPAHLRWTDITRP